MLRFQTTEEGHYSVPAIPENSHAYLRYTVLDLSPGVLVELIVDWDVVDTKVVSRLDYRPVVGDGEFLDREGGVVIRRRE